MPSNGEMYLHAAGREDIDVRMLGKGRPFIFEFINPKKWISCFKNIDKMSVQSPYVSCTDLKIVDKSFFDRLKEIEGSKAKSYAAVICSKQPFTQADADILNKTSDLTLAQQTPIRVLHRRSQMVREKKIYRLHATIMSKHIMLLHILGGAGTYIKEFVHGDLGRTTPNVGTFLGREVDILQLDVTEVYDSIDVVDLNDESWH